jgi:hypothetical protein
VEKLELTSQNTKNSSAKEDAMEGGVRDWLWLSHPILKIRLRVLKFLISTHYSQRQWKMMIYYSFPVLCILAAYGDRTLACGACHLYRLHHQNIFPSTCFSMGAPAAGASYFH